MQSLEVEESARVFKRVQKKGGRSRSLLMPSTGFEGMPRNGIFPASPLLAGEYARRRREKKAVPKDLLHVYKRRKLQRKRENKGDIDLGVFD